MPQTWNPETYGRDGAFVHELAGGVLEWLAPQPGERILDLGCGDGQLTLRIAASGASVVGIDASPAMVAAARARGVEADNGPAESCPIPIRPSTPSFPMPCCTGSADKTKCSRKSGAFCAPAAASSPRWAATATLPPSAPPSQPSSRATDLLLSATAAITIPLPRSTAAAWSDKDLPCRRSLTSLAPPCCPRAAWPAG